MTTSRSVALKLVDNVLSDRKNVNKVVDLISLLDVNQKAETLHVVLNGVCIFFSNAFKKKELLKHKDASFEMELYHKWIKERYNECFTNIVLLLDHESNTTKEQCIITVLKFMESEIASYSQPNNLYFPEAELTRLVEAFMKYDIASSVPEFCASLWKLADLRYFTLKCIPKCLIEDLAKSDSKSVMPKTFSLLKSISESMPSNMDNALTLAGADLTSLFPNSASDVVPASGSSQSEDPAKAVLKTLDMNEQRKAFGNVWLEFLRHDMSSHLFKSVLIILQKDVIPNFASPCLLADFLTRSFNQGGGIALLSLHSLFVLMNEHNLEYPEFYTHLYSMVHPRIFDAKYQSRFFFLLNLFLSSTHLPAYLVAAFTKKLSRLTLVAPTYAQQLLVNFILTLIDRHPTIKVLINQNTPKGSKESAINNDPYLASQPDPVQCKAMESSLWELMALSNLYLPSVAAAVKNIDQGPKQDVMDLLEDSYEETFDSLCDKEFTDAPLNFQSPVQLLGGFEDSVAELWAV